ncbi:MAG: hypothetical protein JWO67_3149, partial [Streptosporangiaceae bacterium]|nr:hypothetical protein [Streptosporangiaceae bacterium]
MKDTTFTAPLQRYYRACLLEFASNLAVVRTSPAAVATQAAALQDWMDEGDSLDDKKNRFEALHRADMNRDSKRIPDGKPELLIAEA